MDNKKFETLIDLIINENEEQARELFHEIVVEKSREIYESIMDEEMMEAEDNDDEKVEESAEEDDADAIEESMDDMEEGQMVGQVGDLLDEINAEESGVTEEEDEEVFDLEADGEEDLGDEGDAGGEGMEDAVIRIEDKLDQLMAEFEEIMGGEGADDMGDEADMGGDEEVAADEEGEEAMMEAVQLQKVSVTHGDNGVQTKSPGLQNSGQAGMDSKPVKFSGQAETVPTSPKGPSNSYSKGETQVPGAGKFKNAPGHKGADLSKAPAPKKGDNGANTKSIVAK
jgi:hypothetical protein